MADIVDRLKQEGENAMRQHLSLGMHKLCEEAAAEIERLRVERASLYGIFNASLPCDVKLPPATKISKGVAVSTLLASIDQRRKWPSEQADKLRFPTAPLSPEQP